MTSLSQRIRKAAAANAALRLRRRNPRGSALMIAMGFILIVGFVLATMMTTSMQTFRNSVRKQITDSSLLAAQNALEAMANNVIWIANNRPPQLNGSITAINQFVEAVKAPTPSSQYEVLASYVRPWNSAANDWSWQPITDPADYWYGYTSARLDYEVVAVVRDRLSDSQNLDHPGIALRKRVTIDYIPVWSYWAMSGGNTGPFELHNGPTMTVRGRMHSNNDIRFAPGAQLAIYGEITSVGRFFWGAGEDFTKNADLRVATRAQLTAEEATPGSVAANTLLNLKGAATSNRTYPGNQVRNYLDSRDPNWATLVSSQWGGTIKDAAFGVRDVNPPLPENARSIDMIKRMSGSESEAEKAIRFEHNADLKIYGDPTQARTTWTVRDNAGNTIPATYRRPGDTSDRWIFKQGSFRDRHERKDARTIDIDMAALREWQQYAKKSDGTPLNFQFTNGVVYASTNNNTNSANLNAVRIVNATEVPSAPGNKGLSVATDRPAYTVGDINTVNKKTFMLAADCVKVLSQDISSSLPAGSTAGTPGARSGGATTNMVLMLGNVPTTPGDVNSIDSYVGSGGATRLSGGMHNSMRYLENWAGITHTYNGSIILLYASEVATRANSDAPSGGYYSPPNRAYNWDTSLRTAEPPPGMPAFLYVTEGSWEQLNAAAAVAAAP